LENYEKLGSFYLGRLVDPESRKSTESLCLYDSRDLVTHAVCIGMTGSGKTGLCIDLLEEAAIDGIPALVIDPKGDMGNLLLTFPGLAPADFLSWVNEEEAARKGLSREDFSKSQADLWRKGLDSWGQSPERIQNLKNSAEFAIYTPGSTAGRPVSILKSLSVPGEPVMEDAEALNDAVGMTVTSLLGLLGIESDPFQGREHILLSNLLASAWRDGRDLDLSNLVRDIQSPPFTRIGVMDLESFYPAKERFGLAMKVNSLLASPGFSLWLEGEPLDPAKLLYTPEGKPRVAIFSIAHLGEKERQFFVSMLLNTVLGWVRGLPGTTSLRAILYMDEISGYFPPVANPPTKEPLLKLLKQARAYGLGVVLATQNPVDLDYKGLANIGTWFVGRLQTERDKGRVLEALQGAEAHMPREVLDGVLSSLGNRVFLLHNVHDEEPVLFESRWAMSYLCGPLTRTQIKALQEPVAGAQVVAPVPAVSVTKVPSAQASPLPAASQARGGQAPVLPPDISQVFVPPARGAGSAPFLYRPMLLASGNGSYANARLKVDENLPFITLWPFVDGPVPVDWEQGIDLPMGHSELEKAPRGETADFEDPPACLTSGKEMTRFGREALKWFVRTRRYELFESPSLKMVSTPGETEGDFRVRLQLAAREARDAAVEKLRAKYAKRIETLQGQIGRAELAVQREEQEAKQQKMQTAVSFGATLLGAFMGRKAIQMTSLGRATTAARGVGRSLRAQEDVALAGQKLEDLQAKLEELEVEFEREVASLEGKANPATEVLETVMIRPSATGTVLHLVALAWVPFLEGEGGGLKPAWGDIPA
jgi:Predicted ATPase